MTNDDLGARLDRIDTLIETLPESERGRIRALVTETRERHARIAESSRQAIEALDDWRVRLKYIIFDIEATRRETDARQGSGDEPEQC